MCHIINMQLHLSLVFGRRLFFLTAMQIVFTQSPRSRLLTAKVSTVSQRGYQKVKFDMHEDFCVRIREKKLFLHTSSNLT